MEILAKRANKSVSPTSAARGIVVPADVAHGRPHPWRLTMNDESYTQL